MFDYIFDNKEWLFSGLGISVVAVIWGAFKARSNKKQVSYIQEGGTGSTNIQGENVKIYGSTRGEKE